MSLRLSLRRPIDLDGLLGFLRARAVPGIEEIVGDTYRRTLRLPFAAGTVALRDGGDHVACRLRLEDRRDLSPAVQRCRRLLDLDADPVAVDRALGTDPVLGPLVAAHPGKRVPGAVDGAEIAIRAIAGQQVSVSGARTLLAKLVAKLGEPLAVPDGGLTHLFPEPGALAAARPDMLGMPASRGRALLGVAAAVHRGTLSLDPGADRGGTARALLDQPGIGPWTASYVAMRALGDSDAFLATDLGTRRACQRLGLPTGPAALSARADAWRPWRAYALQHLWGSLEDGGASRARSSIGA